jgi:putative ABC transport system ATP-binding protein
MTALDMKLNEGASRPTAPLGNEVIASVEGIRKTYYMGSLAVEVLHGISLDFYSGDYVSIRGPSGCGKSTLMNILGCLDQPTEGKYYLGDEDTSTMEDDELSAIRGARLGFIFQSYNLIQQLNVLENIEMPLFYQGYTESESNEIALSLAERVGLSDRVGHKPYELSGGQQQRVAIARALAVNPLIILADEPTGNLDTQTATLVMDVLTSYIRSEDAALLLVTHDEAMARRCDTIYRLEDETLKALT